MNEIGYYLSDLVPMAVHLGDIAIESGGFHHCTTAWRDEQGLVWDVCRIYFPVKGAAVVTLGDNEAKLRAGRGYFIPGGTPHRHHCADSMDVHWLHLRPASVELNLLLSRIGRVIALAKPDADYWRPVIEQTAAYLESPEPELSCRMHAMALHLIADAIARGVSEDDRIEVAAQLSEFGDAIAYMDDHYRDNPSLDDLAAIVHRSPSWFHKRFTQVVGITPHAYMLARRMRLANRLLLEGDLRVTDVAREAGYDNVFYFSRVYRQYFDRTAAEDRGKSEPRP